MSKPVLLKGMAKDWPAFKLWSEGNYIKDKSGDIQIKVERTDRLSNDFAYFKNNDNFGRQTMKYSEFLNSLQD